MWRDRKNIELFGIEHPILLAPMARPFDRGVGNRRFIRPAALAPSAAASTPEDVRDRLGGDTTAYSKAH
jgi:hypothetical protein